jgi:hypothetical protein
MPPHSRPLRQRCSHGAVGPARAGGRSAAAELEPATAGCAKRTFIHRISWRSKGQKLSSYLTRKEARSLLSIAKLKIARSRLDPAIANLTRMDQTRFGSSGFFWPISNPLFHGRWRLPVGYTDMGRPPPSALCVARPRATQCIPTRWSGPIERDLRPAAYGAKRSLTCANLRSRWLSLAGPGSNFPMMDWTESSSLSIG